MVNYKSNQTVKFILPLVVNIAPAIILRDGFIGAYIGDVEKPQYDGKLLLAYETPQTFKHLKQELLFMEQDNYYTSYDYTKDGVVVYVFDIPEDTVDTVELVLDGHYSKIRPEDKIEISKFWFKRTNKKSLVDKVFADDKTDIMILWHSLGINREDVCSVGEYWFKPNFVDELLYIEV